MQIKEWAFSEVVSFIDRILYYFDDGDIEGRLLLLIIPLFITYLIADYIVVFIFGEPSKAIEDAVIYDGTMYKEGEIPTIIIMILLFYYVIGPLSVEVKEFVFTDKETLKTEIIRYQEEHKNEHIGEK